MSRLLAILLLLCGSLFAEQATPEIISSAIVMDDAEAQTALIQSLIGKTTPEALELLRQWKEGELYIHTDSAGTKTAVIPQGEKDANGQQTIRHLADGKTRSVPAEEVETADTSSTSRMAIKAVIDMAALFEPEWRRRLQAIKSIGLQQEVEKLPALQTALGIEKNADCLHALQEAIALAELKSDDPTVKLAACDKLGNLQSIPSQDVLKTTVTEATAAGDIALATAAQQALDQIAKHVSTVNTIGTMFRGLSTGSVLLVVAIGLAITFGLMGVINMAHGEMLVVGAYTTYIVQNIFGTGLHLSPFGISFNVPGLNTTGWFYNCYFIVALPAAFLVAALVGIGLERSIIRFLYKRPLESLLATWGVSLVLQQLFRLIFGASNVDVSSPTWLSGNWTVNDVQFGWNRVFVIAFAVVIVFLTWAVLNKTSLGMLIRAVMQNRSMAACMGVRTERVNMLTFGFGSGLAGLAGAFLSQIDNVGPGLGQKYIVDSFMTVVVGGVGKLTGTVISALGIGIADQSLQQILPSPVLGKILVLVSIILFLQWRPSGIFVTKSRSLES